MTDAFSRLDERKTGLRWLQRIVHFMCESHAVLCTLKTRWQGPWDPTADPKNGDTNGNFAEK